MEQSGISSQSFFILGSGARAPDKLGNKNSVDGSFVRGPLSASTIENRHPYITDSAYLIRQTDWFTSLPMVSKKHKISIIPYFRSMPYIDSSKIKELGMHMIDPRIPESMEATLQQIYESEMVICEAMHGAIVSDILRVPWTPLEFLASSFEGRGMNSFKWNDWQLSIKQEECKKIHAGTYHSLIAKTRNYNLKNRYLGIFKKNNLKRLIHVLKTQVNSARTYLSSDNEIHQIDLKMKESLNKLKNV